MIIYAPGGYATPSLEAHAAAAAARIARHAGGEIVQQTVL